MKKMRIKLKKTPQANIIDEVDRNNCEAVLVNSAGVRTTGEASRNNFSKRTLPNPCLNPHLGYIIYQQILICNYQINLYNQESVELLTIHSI
ncbi:hypothetical protein DU53_07230 [Kosmotoga sp. DU53]|nr:hypothetical protein DU53_07230 [Kosmotoga sp. DU53]